MDQEYRHIWGRLGADMALTKEEIEILMHTDETHGYDNGVCTKIILKAFAENRIQLAGDCYIPDTSVETYNEEYGTDYEESECCWYM